MAIQSMTGFGKGESGNDSYNVNVEIKSVNHRFKDLRFKMSSKFNPIELTMRERLSAHFKRGSFDIYVNYKKATTTATLDNLDTQKIQNYLQSLGDLAEDAGVSLSPSATEFLRNEFFKDEDDQELETLRELVLEAYTKALETLKESREQEGEKLVKILHDHREKYEKTFSQIEPLTEEYRKGVESKLRKKMNEYKDEVNVDENRFLQEVIYYMEKLDVHEEINRIKSHLSKLSSLIQGPQEVGRQIDFILQELNRETNTIGSKSGSEKISDCVVKMKSQLEKIREQALNLE